MDTRVLYNLVLDRIEQKAESYEPGDATEYALELDQIFTDMSLGARAKAEIDGVTSKLHIRRCAEDDPTLITIIRLVVNELLRPQMKGDIQDVIIDLNWINDLLGQWQTNHIIHQEYGSFYAVKVADSLFIE